MTDDELIAALEAAEGPSAALDDAITLALGWEITADGKWIDPNSRLSFPLDWTHSLDAALTLVPAGWGGCVFLSGAVRLTKNPPGLGEVCRSLANNEQPRKADGTVVGTSDTGSPALALCIAALRARKEQP